MHPEDAAEAIKEGLTQLMLTSPKDYNALVDREPSNGWGSVDGAISFMRHLYRGLSRFPKEHYPNHRVEVSR